MKIIGVAEVDACGGRLVLGPDDLLTPLARDRATDLGVTIGTGEYPNARGAPPPENPPKPLTARAAGGRPSGPQSPTGPADPPVGALYRRGAPVVGDHLLPEV